MSIETDLGRIAVALETIVKHLTADKSPTSAPATPVKKVPAKPAAAAAVEADPFNDQNNNAAAEISYDTLKELLTKHAVAFGTKTTVTLIKKHGADAVTPKINTIPQNNYQTCYDEAMADLKKAKKI